MYILNLNLFPEPAFYILNLFCIPTMYTLNQLCILNILNLLCISYILNLNLCPEPAFYILNLNLCPKPEIISNLNLYPEPEPISWTWTLLIQFIDSSRKPSPPEEKIYMNWYNISPTKSSGEIQLLHSQEYGFISIGISFSNISLNISSLVLNSYILRNVNWSLNNLK